ncbi:MAG: S-layer family protein [Planctomycetes bacterium]|nr:S-layer family protein [Planctomycetota bacterium]
MHRLKASLLCLLSLSFAASAFGQAADSQPDDSGRVTYDSYSGGATLGSEGGRVTYSAGPPPGAGAYAFGRYMSGNGVGYQGGGFTNVGGMVPFWVGSNTMIGADARAMFGNNTTFGGNFGLVARQYLENWDRSIGAAGYYDIDQSYSKNNFHQATFGLETLGRNWDARINGYFTGGVQDKFVSNGGALCVSGDPFFSGNQIVFNGQRAVLREQAMSGFDVEFGVPVFPSTPWLRAYAGAYYYHASQVKAPPIDEKIPNTTEDNPLGFRGRLEAQVANDLIVGVNVTTDRVWGTNVNAVADFRFSGFHPTRYFPQLTTRDRMLSPWQRNWRIAIEQYGTTQTALVAAINPNTGNPYFVSFIDNSNPNAGNGTFENPFNSFDHPNGIPNADIIVVERGTSTQANPYLGSMLLLNNQQLLGEGGTMTPLSLSATYGNCTVAGNFVLPGIDGSGNYPFVSNPNIGSNNGNAIVLANNNVVSGFNIENSANNGIFGNGVNNFDLHGLEIFGNTGSGINLVNATGTTNIIADVNQGVADHANPDGLGNNAGGGIIVSTGVGGISDLQLTNVAMNSNPVGTQPFGIDLIANNGPLTTTLTNVQANGNGTGIILTETNQNLNVTLNDVSASNNVADGLDVSGNGGTVTLTSTTAGSPLDASLNGGTGINITQAGGTGTYNLTGTTANQNGVDGLKIVGSSAATTIANLIGAQFNQNIEDGIHNAQSGGSTSTMTVSGTNMNQNGRDGFFYDLSGGSTLNSTFTNALLNSNGRSGFFGNMNNSTATINLTNTTATNSAASAFVVNGTNNSVLNSTVSGGSFSNSGANGIFANLTNSSATMSLTGTSDDNNVLSGVNAQANINSTFSLTANNSTFDNSVNGYGFLGTATTNSTINLNTSNNTSFSGNSLGGVSGTATNSNIIAALANTAVNNNGGDGIKLDLSGSTGSTLALTGTTTVNGNAANGLDVIAKNSSVFTPTLTNTQLLGNTIAALKFDVQSNSSVGTALNPGILNNVTGTGSQTGLLSSVTSGGILDLMINNSDFHGNSQHAISSSTSGTGSSTTLLMDTVDLSGSGQSNVLATASAGGFVNLDIDNSNVSGSLNSAGIQTSADGVNSSMNVCLENSTVSNNKLQGIVIDASNSGTVSYGVGTLNVGSASSVNNNGLEGVLANAVSDGTVNFRSIGSHFDGNGTAAVADGLFFGADNGHINTLFYGGSADFNSGNGVELGPTVGNLSSNNSDLTLNVGNGFSASNNGLYGLVLQGNGANSANFIQDPNSAPIVLTGNGTGPENLQFSGANQVLLQLLGSFNGSAGDGVHLVFQNITTAIVSINGQGTGTIDNNIGNGIYIEMDDVTNAAVTVSGYTSISNNGLNGIHIEMNGNTKTIKGAIEISGPAGNTLMDSNGQNGVDIQLVKTNLVDPFNSLPGVNLTVLTTTDNQSFNSCIPQPVVLAAGGSGIIPQKALLIQNLDVENTGASGGTGGITVAGTNATIVSNQGFIQNNTVNGTLNGIGIGVDLSETVAPTGPIANGMQITGNTVTNTTTDGGIRFLVNDLVATNFAVADNLHINNNIVTGNAGIGILESITNAAGSNSSVNGMQISGNTVSNNTGDGILSILNSAGSVMNANGAAFANNTIDGNTSNGLELQWNNVTSTALNISGDSITNNNGDGILLGLTTNTISNVTLSSDTIDGNTGDGIRALLNNSTINGLTSTDLTITNNDQIGLDVAATAISALNGATFTNANISNNGLDGVALLANDGTNSTFGTALNPILFSGSTITDNGQLGAGDGVRAILRGGSTGNVNFTGTTIGNTLGNLTQQNGVNFVLGAPGSSGKLVTAFTDSFVTGNVLDGIVGVVNGTNVAGASLANVSITNTSVSSNGGTGVDLTVNKAGTVTLAVTANSLIDGNGIDGVNVTALDANTTVTGLVSNSSLTNNGTTGVGNGLTGVFDNAATGAFTIDTAVIGNSAVGGTQQSGIELDVNQNTIATATNVSLDILNSTLSNNAVSAVLGTITGNNVAPNPTTGLEITLTGSTVDSNGVDGMAFNVNNGALLSMSVADSFVTGSGHNGLFVGATDAFTLVAIDMADSQFNNNGTIFFPGDGFNATVDNGATLNVCAETTTGAINPMSFSGNTGDGFDVYVSGANSISDIDFHSVIAGADAANGLLGNTLDGFNGQVYDGGQLHVRTNTSHFDGNLGAGFYGTVNDTNGLDTTGIFRIIGGTADNNGGDGFSFLATNSTVVPIGTATMTTQFQADDFGNGISAQNNGGYGLNFIASNLTPPGGGIVGNLLMTGGSTLLGNAAGTLNVDMNGADQAIIGLSGTFDGSTTGDGIHIDLQNITGLALVSLQGPGEVKNNAGDGIDVSMTNVAQGGVFIGGFSDVSNNGTGNNPLIGQDGIKVTMSGVGLGAVTIDAQTTLLPSNIMNVSNNTGNGVNVIVNNGSVIDNTAFNGILGANLVNVIDYTAPDAPCPTPLPNPLLNIVAVNASTALGITFQPTLAIQNLTVDNNGTATGGNLSGDGIVLTADTGATIVGTPTINNNTITNTGLGSSTTTHDGIVANILGNANVTGFDIVQNDVESNNGNGVNFIANGAATLASLNISNNTISNNTGGLGTSGNGIVLDLKDAAVLSTVTIDRDVVTGNKGDGFQMLNPATGVDLTVNFTHDQFIGNGSIVPPSATTTYPAGGMGIDIVLNNLNAIRNTINVTSDAAGINTVSNNASFGLFLQATNQSLYNLNVTGTGARNVFNANTDAGIAVVGGSFVNPNSSLDPTKFSVGNVKIDNVNITNTRLGSHPSLPNYPFSGDGIGILLQQYAQMNSFVIGSAAARNTTLSGNAGDGLRINAIEQSQFRQTLADNTTAVTALGQATILLQQIDATGNTRNGIDIIRRDNALLSWDDATINAGAALFNPVNLVSWQAITDGGSFIHINDVISTNNGINGLNVSTTNAQFPITRIDIVDSNPVAMTYNPKTVGHSVYDSNTGRGMQFIASADSILVVNARDTSASDNLQGGILVQTFNRATFGDVLTATPLGDPTSDNSIRSTFNGMLISGNGRSNLNANAYGFEVQANGGSDPFNVSSSSVVNISMTGTATNARNLFDSNGGDDFRITASRFSDNYFNLNRIDMRDTAFVQLGNDGLHVLTTDGSSTRIDLTNTSIGYPTASSTQTGLSGDGIDATTTSGSFLNLNVGNTLALNRFGGGIAAGAADPTNAPDVSIFGNKLNGIVIRNQASSSFIGNVFDTASRFNGNRGYSAQMQDSSTNFHGIDHSLFSDNSFEGIAVIANSRQQSGFFRDIASVFTTNPAFINGYQLYNFLNYNTTLNADFVLTNSTVSNNGSASPYVNSIQNVNGLEIDVSTWAAVNADIRNNTFHGNTLDDVATASFQASTGGFNANGTINTTGLLNTPGSVDEIVSGVDRIFLEDTAQLDMRFINNVGDQVSISSAGSNNPNMGAFGAHRTDPNTKINPNSSAQQQTSLFQVDAYHYDVVNTVTSNNIFTGTHVQALDSNVTNFVQDPTNFPGSTTQPGPVIAARFLEAALVSQANFYVNPNANPNNPNIASPTAFTQVRVDDITTGVNGTGANGVIDYTAGGQFTLAGAGSAGITAGDVFRIHLLDTNTFNQFGVAQNVEAAFNNGFVNHVVQIPQGQTATNSGTFFTTNKLAPYFDWPSSSFPPN